MDLASFQTYQKKFVLLPSVGKGWALGMKGYGHCCTKLHADQEIWLLPKETKSKHYNVQKEGMLHPAWGPGQGEENFSCAIHCLELFYLTNVGDIPQPAGAQP